MKRGNWLIAASLAAMTVLPMVSRSAPARIVCIAVGLNVARAVWLLLSVHKDCRVNAAYADLDAYTIVRPWLWRPKSLLKRSYALLPAELIQARAFVKLTGVRAVKVRMATNMAKTYALTYLCKNNRVLAATAWVSSPNLVITPIAFDWDNDMELNREALRYYRSETEASSEDANNSNKLTISV